MDAENPMQELLNFLGATPPGPIADRFELVCRLDPCWTSFSGSHAEGMTGDKLYGRMEEVVWDPPYLEFIVERHGSTVMGSSRAPLHRWTLNVETRSASCEPAGYRQVRPREAKLDVHPIAEEIGEQILNRREDGRLKWHTDGTVSVQIGKIDGLEADLTTAKQTVSGRRDRFRKALDEQLKNAGWQRIRANVYAPPQGDSSAS